MRPSSTSSPTGVVGQALLGVCTSAVGTALMLVVLAVYA